MAAARNVQRAIRAQVPRHRPRRSSAPPAGAGAIRGNGPLLARGADQAPAVKRRLLITTHRAPRSAETPKRAIAEPKTMPELATGQRPLRSGRGTRGNFAARTKPAADTNPAAARLRTSELGLPHNSDNTNHRSAILLGRDSPKMQSNAAAKCRARRRQIPCRAMHTYPSTKHPHFGMSVRPQPH